MSWLFPGFRERQRRGYMVYKVTTALWSIVAILVIVAYIRYRQAEPTKLAEIGLWAAVFFWARVAHAVVYWLGIPYLRTIAFVVGVVATAVIFTMVM